MPNPNRAHWNEKSARYQQDHDQQIGRMPMLWGAWSIPEAEIRALGDLGGLRVLEHGCGAAQWARSIVDQAAMVVGLDLSEEQLKAARAASEGMPLPFVHADGEFLPFASMSFDLVFSDHGGMSWGDPARTVPEVSRVLRRGGRLVFNSSSPLMYVCANEERWVIEPRLHRDYFGMRSEEEGDGARSYNMPYGAWIRLFRDNRLRVDDLIEPRPPAESRSTYYQLDPPDWASRWPAEMMWVLTKES